MNASSLFPFRVFTSLPKREDRREKLLPPLNAVGLSARWIRPVPTDAIRDAHGFHSIPKRSCAITKRLAIRLAQREKASTLLYLKDDVIFHPQFEERIAALELPDDWGIFYFGCQHSETPEPASPSLVRVNRAFDCHACVIRSPHDFAARKIMRGGPKGAPPLLYCDVLFSALHKTVPTYAAFPNLAWQGVEQSDLAGIRYSNYEEDGSQKLFRHVLEPLLTKRAEPPCGVGE